ncbi:MAG TPA: SAM-dependent methyltransferase, partial [Candidatus Dormibacteraeota bacterium]|nr:SAM-dependent methyltransferase [Candidatus Dormibacteraeota bacterium]
MDARRQPPPSVAAAPGSDPDLVRQLRAEIERDGPITFARFMEVALYDPSHGYYATSEARPTRAGDFLTAPELDPVFGRLIGRQVTECWERLGRPIDFTVREYGAGRGTLAVTLLEGMRADGSELAGRLRYEPIEVDPTRQRAVQERVRRAAFGDTLPGGPAGPEEGESGAGALRPLVGVVIANEFLD